LRALVDTHALLWFLDDDKRLGQNARTMMRSGRNELLFSAGCCWELAIKHAIGKITLRKPFDQFLWPELQANEIDVLAIEPEHLNKIAALPHHRDPFDRLLVAQALVEHVPVVSSDAALDGYGVERVW
jgi:PIN domain nuclease of toxin-antitoxin system